MSKKPPALWKRALEAAVGEDSPGAPPLANRLLAKLPGGEVVQQQIDRVEKRVLGELKARLDRLDPNRGEASVQLVAVSVGAEDRGHAPSRDLREPAEMMRELLAISAEQTREQARTAYYASLVRPLLPDEARILSALHDGTAYPLVNLVALSKLGIQTHVVLEHTCSVGRAAGVQLPEMTRGYVQRLLAAGLAETGPEDYTLTTKYEILETDETLRRLMNQLRSAGQRSQIKRRVLRISELGRDLWDACRITED